MTNAEQYQQDASKAKEKGLLNDWEESFFEDAIKGKDKKGLRKLTSKQFKALRAIAERYSDAIEE